MGKWRWWLYDLLKSSCIAWFVLFPKEISRQCSWFLPAAIADGMKRKVILVKLLTDESTTLPTIEAFSPKVTITVSTLKRVNEVDVGEFIDFPDNQFNMDPLNIYFM